MPRRTLTINNTDFWVFGVCGGLGRYLGIDPVLVRAVFFIAIFGYGTGLGIYLLLLVLMPLDDYNNPE